MDILVVVDIDMLECLKQQQFQQLGPAPTWKNHPQTPAAVGTPTYQYQQQPRYSYVIPTPPAGTQTLPAVLPPPEHPIAFQMPDNTGLDIEHIQPTHGVNLNLSISPIDPTTVHTDDDTEKQDQLEQLIQSASEKSITSPTPSLPPT